MKEVWFSLILFPASLEYNVEALEAFMFSVVYLKHLMANSLDS